MHHGEEYFAAFDQAAQKSVDLGLLRGVPVRRPDEGRAIDALDLVGRMINSMPYISTKIRLMCGQIHSELWRWLRQEDVPCLLTVGDIEVGGKREYGTTYELLEQELGGALRDTDKPYPFHVWLTFPDLHIIDVTYFVWKHHDLLPEPWTWSEYIVCSDHSFSERVDTRYLPYLVGDATLVERMIFDAPTARSRTVQPSEAGLLDTLASLRMDGDRGGKTGRNEPCPCGSGKKFKKCHG